eukprot:3284737-Pleurochrysis_carterae.AAC.1
MLFPAMLVIVIALVYCSPSMCVLSRLARDNSQALWSAPAPSFVISSSRQFQYAQLTPVPWYSKHTRES